LEDENKKKKLEKPQKNQMSSSKLLKPELIS
jgi:hypothetical protein